MVCSAEGVDVLVFMVLIVASGKRRKTRDARTILVAVDANGRY